MTASISQREQTLLSLVQENFPNHHARLVMGTLSDVQKLDLVDPPEIQLGVKSWQAAHDGFGQPGGAAVWCARIVESELRAPSLRRDAIHSAAIALRELLHGVVLAAGHSPLISAGGKLLTAGDPWAVWEETWIEHMPRHGDVRPCFARNVESMHTLLADVDAGSAQLPYEGTALNPGDLIVLHDPQSGLSAYCGEVVATHSSSIDVERAPAHEFASGTIVYRLVNDLRMSVTPAAGSRELVLPGASTHFNLAGGAHRALFSEQRRQTELQFAPVTASAAAAIQQYLQQHRMSAEFLYGAPDGELLRVSVHGNIQIQRSGKTATITLPLTFQEVTSLGLFEVEE